MSMVQSFSKRIITLKRETFVMFILFNVDQLLKGYCTVFQHALKLLEQIGIDLT